MNLLIVKHKHKTEHQKYIHDMIHCGEALTLTDGLVLTGPNKDISLLI